MQTLSANAAELDWPASTLEQQRNWIGRSEGAEIKFAVKGSPESIRVFSTRPDTLFGATYMVLAPEHPVVTCDDEVAARRCGSVSSQTQSKSELERGANAEKTGVDTGGLVINPATGKEIPMWIANYVLMGYGTGAIMAVPVMMTGTTPSPGNSISRSWRWCRGEFQGSVHR